MTIHGKLLGVLLAGGFAAAPCAGAAQPARISDAAFSSALSGGLDKSAFSGGAYIQPAAYTSESGTPVETAIHRSMPSVFKVTSQGSTGSGFVLYDSGIAVTNAHVLPNVAKGGEVTLTTADGEDYKGVLLVKGSVSKRDLAFIQLQPRRDGKPWKAFRLKKSGRVAVGSQVMAMGHPRGLEFSVSRGIISGLDRLLPNLTFLQTDAAINPGNSGGPLVSEDGELVGMNTQILTHEPGGGSEGLGFAIIADDIELAWRQFKKTGNLDAPWIGLMVAPDFSVYSMPAGSPAGKAGIQTGDIIAGLEGGPCRSVSEFMNRLNKSAPGETVRILVMRGEETLEIPVTLEAEPAPVQPRSKRIRPFTDR